MIKAVQRVIDDLNAQGRIRGVVHAATIFKVSGHL